VDGRGSRREERRLEVLWVPGEAPATAFIAGRGEQMSSAIVEALSAYWSSGRTWLAAYGVGKSLGRTMGASWSYEKDQGGRRHGSRAEQSRDGDRRGARRKKEEGRRV
jgi:hypothetical protein